MVLAFSDGAGAGHFGVGRGLRGSVFPQQGHDLLPALLRVVLGGVGLRLPESTRSTHVTPSHTWFFSEIERWMVIHGDSWILLPYAMILEESGYIECLWMLLFSILFNLLLHLLRMQHVAGKRNEIRTTQFHPNPPNLS